MGRETVLFNSEEKNGSVEVVAVLRRIANKIEKGRSMKLRQGKSQIVLDFPPPSNMTLEIKVEDEVKKRKGHKRTFEVELEWYPAAGDKRCGVTIE